MQSCSYVCHGRCGEDLETKLDWSEDNALADDEDEDSDQGNVKLEKKYSSATVSTVNLLDERQVPYELIVRLLEKICLEDPTYVTYSAAILVFMPGMGEIRRLSDMLTEHPQFGSEALFRIFPLHSTISSEQQGAVFEVPPPGIRKIVIGKCNSSPDRYLILTSIIICSYQYRRNWYHHP